MTRALAGLCLASVLWSVSLRQVKCPIDDMMAYFTGKSETVSGHLMYQYKCAQGHIFWVRADRTI